MLGSCTAALAPTSMLTACRCAPPPRVVKLRPWRPRPQLRRRTQRPTWLRAQGQPHDSPPPPPSLQQQELKERLQAAAAEGDEMAAAALAAAEVLAAAGAQSDAAGKALESALGILVPDSWERTELGEVAVAALELFAASGVDPGTVPMLPPWSEEEEAEKYKPGFGFAHYAAYKDRADVLALLARLGANLEAGGPAGTPLQIAAGGDATDVVRALCAAGVDVNARAPLDFPNSDLAGATALHFAVASPGSPHPDNLQVLLDAGADPLLMDAQGRTPYAFLMDKIQEDLYLGPNLSYGWSALYQEQIDAVSILLSAQEAAKKAGTQRAGM